MFTILLLIKSIIRIGFLEATIQPFWDTCQVNILYVNESGVIADIKYCDACFIPKNRMEKTGRKKGARIFANYKPLLYGNESATHPQTRSVYRFEISKSPDTVAINRSKIAGIILDIG